MPKSGHAVLVLGGNPPSPELLKEFADFGPVIAVDGGTQACIEAAVEPMLVTGDFDSFNREDIPESWISIPTPNQDRTDFQKACDYLPEGTTQIWILGGLGARLDHEISNLQIASTLPQDLNICFVDEQQVMHRVTPECPYRGKHAVGQQISPIPILEAKGYSSRGLKWNLHQAHLAPGVQLTQSNEVAEEDVFVAIDSGCLFVWAARGDSRV